jgi:hypothetical protein
MSDRTPGGRQRRLDQMERTHQEIMDRLGPTGTGVGPGPHARRATIDRLLAREDADRYQRELTQDRELDEDVVALVRAGSAQHQKPLVLRGHERSRPACENPRS